ncbi:TIGR03083 family protein [Microlunatus soli]|uniref:TIGR03083 family protein n=2 Tax=Microlunatus soli TaxID=630515 RepID=A0A1H1ZID2_9ACTN|nr:TIGR03083 family protein [Microlunatus soli]
MPLTPQRCADAITEHSRGLADAVIAGDLRARVAHCPDWNVADLVWHVTGVHWFWHTIASERLSEPPAEERRPIRPPDDRLVSRFRAGAEAIAETLATADQSAPCWTWFPPQQDVAFVTRHQVQEAVVHHFDAADAIGQSIDIAADIAVDCVEEFLTTSLADADDVAALRETKGLALDGELVLHATDVDRSWTVFDQPGSGLLWRPGGDAPAVSGTAADLLLWIYGRTELPEQQPELIERFRRMSSTD